MNSSRMITTPQVADLFGVLGDSIRRALCVKGHYLGIVPVKLPNGRLMWPKDQAEALLDRGAAQNRACEKQIVNESRV